MLFKNLKEFLSRKIENYKTLPISLLGMSNIIIASFHVILLFVFIILCLKS